MIIPGTLTLGELIAILEKEDPEKVLPLGFHNPHSYRGYYEDLAFEPKNNVKIGDMLRDAKSALGATFEGYKGGDFTMDEYTSCWLSMIGTTGETIGYCFIKILLSHDVSVPEPDSE